MTARGALDHMINWLGYISADEAGLLQDVARLLPDNPVIINVGAGSGTSGLALLTSRSDASVCTVDITLENHPRGGIGSEATLLRSAGIYDEVLASGRYRSIHGDTREVSKGWDDGPVDFVFIDDGHSYEEASADIEGWLPHIVDGGFIAVHDYMKQRVWEDKNPDVPVDLHTLRHAIKPWPGVDSAVDDVLRKRHNLEETHRVDTTVVFRVKK